MSKLLNLKVDNAGPYMPERVMIGRGATVELNGRFWRVLAASPKRMQLRRLGT